MKEITILYDGKYPNLCSGQLTVIIGKETWKFPDYCMVSGGGCGFYNDYSESYVDQGEWSIDDDKWPDEFPEDYKDYVLDEINIQVAYGCCGGCL